MPEIISREEAIKKGFRLYFTGEKCGRGHISERVAASRNCVECAKINRAEIYARNREKAIADAKRWYEENKDRAKRTRKEYYAKTAEISKQKTREWRINNKERAYEATRRWMKAHPEKVKEYAKRTESKPEYKLRKKIKSAEYRTRTPGRVREWIKNNPTRRKEHHQNRRAMKKNNGGKLSPGIVQKLMDLQKNKCACCRVDLNKTGNHLDHIIPLSLGGMNDDLNVQLLCPPCNMSKNAKHPVDFMQEQGFLL